MSRTKRGPLLKTAILLNFNCLPARLLGCYGNEFACTPNFDRLAAESVVFDQHMASVVSSDIDADAAFVPQFADPAPHVESFSVRGENLSGDGFPFRSFPLTRMIGQWKELAGCGSPASDCLYELTCDGLSNPWFACDELRAEFETQEFDSRWFGGWTSWPDDFDPVDFSETHRAVESFIEMLDACLGIILDAVEQSATLSNALFVLTAAHGFDLGESRARHKPLAGVGTEWSHVPLLIREPGMEPCRRQVMSQSGDIAPTLADWFAKSSPETSGSGISLLPTLKTERPVRDISTTTCADAIVVRNQNFALVMNTTDAEQTRSRLHLLPDDQWMIHDVAAEYPEIVDELEDIARQRIDLR